MVEGDVVPNRLWALLLLGWSLAKAIVKRLLRTESGLAEFHRHYGAEQLAPLGSEDRQGLARFEGCLACGRCDLGEADRIVAARGAYPGLMQVVLASTRAIPDYDAAARALAHTPDALLEAKTSRCPAGVPFAELAALVRRTSSPSAAAGGPRSLRLAHGDATSAPRASSAAH